ncbi:MAG: EamA family transporter [Candidatus Omnitrophica bacterium]|nr:EamA family transporter [Candidatus Omnitrophota bacterium]
MISWKLFAFASAFFAGVTAIFAKIGVKNISSNFATLIRTFIIVLFLSLLVFLRHEWKNPMVLDRRSLIFLVCSAFTTGLSWLCYYRALQLGPASLVSSIDKLSLALTIALAVLFLGERLTIYQWMGGLLIVVGTVVVMF